MKAICFFGVLLLARILVLAGRNVPLSAWSPVAYLWQDLLIVLVFALLDRITRRRPWIAWMVYSATALYVAINVPLIRLMSSPITMPVLRATRGALADSIHHHLTGENLMLIGLILCAAGVLPLLARRVRLRPRVGVALTAATVVLVALGPFASARVDTGGLHRNVFIALIETAIPRIAAQPLNGDWRTSPYSWDRWTGHSFFPLTPALSAGERENPPPSSGPARDGVCRSSVSRLDEKEALSVLKGTAKGRNVVLILLESTGAMYLKPYGATEDPMPNLTALARQSVLFENAYAVYPESVKGLLSVLCSRYPAFDTEVEVCAKVVTPSIAARLVSEGYRTALFHSGRFIYLGMEEVVQHRGFQMLEDAGDIGGNHESSFGVDDQTTVRRMLNWIDSLPRGERFFITYLPVSGHHPYSSPEPGPFPANEEIGRYRNALHYSDAVLGEFLEGLKARGLFEKTLFVIFGDHGEAFGQHEGDYGHTLFVYEENIHVPYFIVEPGSIGEPIRAGRVASLIDTEPTILDLLGLPISNDCQGSSLLEPQQQMALFYTDYSRGLLGLRDGRWKYICELDSGRSKLFDLTGDADETNDLAARHPERVKAYRRHLQRWAAAQRDLMLHPRDGTTCSTDSTE